MSGWKLKDGELNEVRITKNNFTEIFESFKKGKKTNTYKFFFLMSLISLSKREIKETSVSEFSIEILKKYWEFFIKTENIYPQEKEESLLYRELPNNLFEIPEKIKKNRKEYTKIIKTYVFGAIYKDLNGSLFGFSKKEDILEINNSIIEFVKQEPDIIEAYEIEIENQLNEYLKKQNKIELKQIGGKMAYYQQKFSFEMTFVYKLLNNIEKFRGSKFEIAQELGLGVPKLEALLQYLKIADLLTEENELSLLGNKILKMRYNIDFIEPLILYNLVKNPEKGGHYVYSTFMNDILYDYSVVNFSDVITKKELIEQSRKNNIKNLGRWDDLVGYVYKALSDSESGFGRMGILEKTGTEENVEIHSYWIEPLVGAYIIYDMWKDGQTAMEISNIINEKYNLGRMFLMDADAVKETLLEIQALNLIEVEERSGLDQIRIKKGITKEDILNKIVEEA